MNNSTYSIFSESTPAPLRGLSSSNTLYFAPGNIMEVDLAEHDRIELARSVYYCDGLQADLNATICLYFYPRQIDARSN